MSTPNNLTNIAVSNSGEVDSLLIEKFNGKVREQYLKGENLLSHFQVEEVTGTNTVSNKYLGDTEIQVLAPGQSPAATETKADKNQVVIDTTVIARNTVAMIHDVQGDIDSLKPKIAVNQAKQLKRLEDEMVVQQLLLGGISNTKAKRSTPRVPGHGFSIDINITAGTAEDSPQYIAAAVEFALEQQLEQEVDISDLVIVMPWKWFNALRDMDRIVDRSYTLANDTTVEGFALKSFNCPVVPSNRFPKFAANAPHHKLSNADNGYRYDTTADMAGAVAAIFSMDALLVGRTISLTGDIFYERKEKTYYIDTFMAEGAIPDRWEAVSVVTTARNATTGAPDGTGRDDAAVARRANRKVILTKAVS